MKVSIGISTVALMIAVDRAEAAPDCARAFDALVTETATGAPNWTVIRVLDAMVSGTASTSEALGLLKWAVDTVELYRSCPQESFDSPTGVLDPVMEESDPHTALVRYAKDVPLRSAVLAQVLGTPDGAPSPEPLQFALAQTVSGGQPGFVPSLGGAPSPRAENEVLRHLGLNLSAVVMTPVGTSSGSIAPPIFASIEVFVGISSRRTAYDWYAEIANDLIETMRRFGEIRGSALLEMMRAYKLLREGGAEPIIAAAESMRAARAFFFTRTADHYVNSYVKPEQSSQRFVWAAALRGRVTPDARWTPELPDLVAVSIGAQAELRGFELAPDMDLDFHGALDAALSGYPRGMVPRLADAESGDADWNGRFSAMLGLALEIPAGVGRRARLSASAIGRISPRKMATDEIEASAGGSFSLAVPISDLMAIVGSYTFRCGPEAHPDPCFSTGGLTLAGAWSDL